MLVLDPRSIPKFSVKPANIMVKRENVFYFIEAAVEYGVPKARLFSPADLVLGKNPLKVLQGLGTPPLTLTTQSCSLSLPVSSMSLPSLWSARTMLTLSLLRI